MSNSGSNTPQTTPEPDLSGRQLGDFRLLRLLGHGAMAEVYLAEQCSLRRQIAVKVLKASLASDQNYVRRFHQEAQAVAALVHANIVQIYEVGLENDIHFIAQEYVQGKNLSQYITRQGPIDAPLATTILRQVAAALHKAAEQEIVHRDIKPENIMLSADGQIKVADFGLARVIGEQALNLTQIGVTLGSPLYMSPEQAEGKRLDPRSDLYSLGATCYHILTGRPPFEGPTAISVAMQHVNSMPERLENLRNDLPGGLCRIVHKMLAKDPAERFQQPAELLKELRSLQSDEMDDAWAADLDQWSTSELIASSDSRLQATQQLDALMKTSTRQIKQRNNTKWLAAGAILAALFVGCGYAWLTRQPFLLGGIDLTSTPTFEKKDTAQAQYSYFQTYSDWVSPEEAEAAWKFLEDNFPKSTYYVLLAKQQRARLYLQNLRDEGISPALSIFEELVSLDPPDGEFLAFGHAGLAIVHAYLGDNPKVGESLAELSKYGDEDPLMDLLDGPLRRRITELLDGPTENSDKVPEDS